mmetsp:Transcript_21670/g.30374  ORF Transcript_21670/g.30374 Transcript_21670/m.30374 type:complete len:91 (+) Transcript_21670:990-1262(+)
MHILFCGGPDHWAPKFHMDNLINLQQANAIPNGSVIVEFVEDISHDFVVHSNMVSKVLIFVLNAIKYETKTNVCKNTERINIVDRLKAKL